MRHFTFLTLIALTALLETRCGLAQGTVYISNLGWTYEGIGDIQPIFRGGVPYGSYTAHFKTGADTYSLNAITMEFESDAAYPAGNSPPVQLEVQLFHETPSGNVLIGNLGNPVVNPKRTPWPPSPHNAYTTFWDFTPVLGINLNPSSKYSLVLSMPASSPVDAAVLFAMDSSYTSRRGWTMSPTTSASPYEQGEYLVMAVNASVIPEPDLAVLLSCGFIVLWGGKASRSFAVWHARWKT